MIDPVVDRVLRDAFGDAPVEEIADLKGGRSGATLLSFRAGGRAYVLRRPDPARPMHRARAEREIACLRIAAGRGLAPAVRHVDEETFITIVDKVVPAPSRAPDRLERIARAVRKLHDGPAFPPGPGLGHMVRYFDGEVGLPDALLRAFDAAEAANARFASSGSRAPCHNDLNPGNIVETADGVRFVDWEGACAGDPFVDLAQLGVFMFPTAEARAALLDAYLGRPATDEERERAAITRVLALGCYAGAFFMGAGSGRVNAKPLPMREMLPALGRGEAGPDVVAASLFALMQSESQR